METTLRDLQRELKTLTDPERARGSLRFFKCGSGEYGEGDRFRGITVPELRRLAKEYSHLGAEDAEVLLDSPWHEDRALALFLLVRLYEKGDAARRNRIHKLYLRKLDRVNNWDLVDGSAEYLIGAHVDRGNGKTPPLILRLAKSRDLWRRRIAMLATFHGIKRGNFDPALRVATLLLKDEEDLIHKAVGWLLREIGKRDLAVERRFLDQYSKAMPRTMLRYAIERFPEKIRLGYLAR